MQARFTRRSLGLLTFAAAPFETARAQSAGAAALELMMVERDGCAWCARWDAEIAPLYAKTPEAADAPLRRHNLGVGQPKEAASAVRYTPTFLLLKEGKEIARITGYFDAGMFWGMLDQLLQKAKKA